MNPFRKSSLHHIAASGLTVILTAATVGCSESITMEEVFPAPLIERLPLQVALHYPPALTEYVHNEKSDTDRDWTIRLGTANTRMFDAVFARLFTVTRHVDDRALAAREMPGLDAIVSPTVEAFELALPMDTGADHYAVWIRYVLEVYDRNGKVVVRWPVSGYGQSGTDGLSDKQSMQRAILRALRDAEATIAVGFEKQSAIQEQLLRDVSKEPPKELSHDAP